MRVKTAPKKCTYCDFLSRFRACIFRPFLGPFQLLVNLPRFLFGKILKDFRQSRPLRGLLSTCKSALSKNSSTASISEKNLPRFFPKSFLYSANTLLYA
jgi:hypothetical protein